jgi:predicted kinase
MAGSNPYLLSEAENERVFREEILPRWLKRAGPNLHPAEHPQMVIIGGQPGAGKSRTMDGVERELTHQGGALKISPDDFRKYHQNFKKLNIANDRTSSSFTHEDAGIWAEKLEKYAREHKFNVILEGTLRTPTHQRHHELALARPQHLDPQNITLQDLRGQESDYRLA